MEKEFVPRLSVRRHSMSTMLLVMVRAPCSESRSPGRAMKGALSGQDACSKVVRSAPSVVNARVAAQIDSVSNTHGTSYTAMCDTGHVISNGSESFVFQCGAAGSVSEVLELQSLPL